MKKYTFLWFAALSWMGANAQLDSKAYIRNYGELNNSFFLIKHQKPVKVAFLGGSITDMKGWRELVMARLEKQYPKVKFDFLNAGIPSLGSLPHAFRLKTDVLDKGKVDLMFVESAVNDRVNETSEKIQRRALEGTIRQSLASNPKMELVMMAFVDPDKMNDYHGGKVPVEVQVHEDMAKYYHLPFINLAKEVTDRINAGEFTWEKDFKNLHPAPFGQELYAHTIQALLLYNEGLKQKGLKIRKLPEAMDKGNYSHGNYYGIQHGESLKGFVQRPDWTPADGVSARDGFNHVPVLEGSSAGDAFALDFEGNVIGIASLAGPDAGMVEYTIDGKSYPALDLYTQWSNGLHLPWYKLLADDLGKGKHRLELKISSQKNESSRGHAVRLVNFLIN